MGDSLIAINEVMEEQSDEAMENSSSRELTPETPRTPEHDSTTEQIVTSTPTMNPTMKAAEYIRNNSGFEYSYFVIASPQVKRKIPDSLAERSSSFMSNSSSIDTESFTSPVQNRENIKPTRKSKAILQTIKIKLQKEISKIDLEISRMETESLLILNLRNTIINCRTTLDHVERNKQNIPIADRMRVAVQIVKEKLQSENTALNIDIILPYLNYINNELNEGIRISKIIYSNKTSLLIDCLEELYIVLGRLFGMVETIMLLYYEDDGTDSIDGVDDGDIQCLTADHPLVSQESSFITQLHNQTPINDQSSVEDLQINGMKSTMKVLLQKMNKARKYLNGVERLSAGNPKTKTLLQCFREIQIILGDMVPCEGRHEFCLQEINENFTNLKEILNVSRPGEKELEKSKSLIGELSGRVKIIMKPNIQ